MDAAQEARRSIDVPEAAGTPTERLSEGFDESRHRVLDRQRLGEDARDTVLELEPPLHRAHLGMQSRAVERERFDGLGGQRMVVRFHGEPYPI